MSKNWDQILGDVVESARRNGDFKRHQGHGKPLQMERENPLADPASRLAHQMLKDAGATLPWIEDGKTIDAELAHARATLARAWHWVQVDEQNGWPARSIAVRWDQAVEVFQRQIADLNKQIFRYNLRVPTAGLHRFKINIEEELQVVKER